AFRCVKMCMRVEFHHKKNGMSAFFARTMKSSANAVTTTTMVSNRYRTRHSRNNHLRDLDDMLPTEHGFD
ncbi:MAG: hypothetical protein ACK5PW_00150, partial [Burkholderiales bacterium]